MPFTVHRSLIIDMFGKLNLISDNRNDTSCSNSPLITPVSSILLKFPIEQFISSYFYTYIRFMSNKMVQIQVLKKEKKIQFQLVLYPTYSFITFENFLYKIIIKQYFMKNFLVYFKNFLFYNIAWSMLNE